MKNKKILGLVVIILLAVGFYSLPYITVAQIKAAAEENDGEALSEHVDFPSLRQNLKGQLNTMLAKEMARQADENPLAALGAAFGGMFIEKMVDAQVTPSGLAQIMSGKNPDGSANSTTQGSQDNEPFKNASLSYESMSKFSVTVKDEETGEKTKFILRRSGLSWKLSEILLPI